MLCKSCDSLLVPGVTATHRVRGIYFIQPYTPTIGGRCIYSGTPLLEVIDTSKDTFSFPVISS